MAEAVTASNESRAALARTRTEARELTNELTSARAALSTQEMECARQRTRAENAEYLQRNLRLDGDRLREELGQQRREMAAVQDQQQRTQAELELLRQRYAARNAEQRLLELSSVAHLPLPTPPQELRLPQQASQAVRQGGGRREADLSGQPHVSAPSASMNVLSARSNELDAEANQSVLSIPHSQEEPRRSRPHYQLPPRLSHGGDVTHTSRSKAVTAMGIKRRAQSSFLLQDSESSDDDVGGGLGGGPHRGRGVPTAGPRRSASSLEEALVTQDLGAPGADDVDTSASEGRWAAEDSAGEEETQQLRRMAEDMQAQALRAAQRADSAIRTSLDKEQLQEAIESGRDAVKTEEVAVLERYARLRNLHDKR